MKYDKVAEVIERRIQRGDYVVSGVPGERELASEQGVSHMTARRAVQKLIDEGILVRKSNGRLMPSDNDTSDDGRKTKQVAFLAPDFDSRQISLWRLALVEAAAKHSIGVRALSYTHWEDLTVSETFAAFDATFFIALPDLIPTHVDNLLRCFAPRLVSLELDLSHLGVRSINPFPVVCIRRLLDHLYQLGHRSIDCLNTQPVDKIALDRIAQWELWRTLQGVDGVLHNDPVKVLESPLPRAYELVSRLIEERRLTSTAILCNTEPAAIGAIRALREHNYVVGQDISVCAVNDEGLAQYLSPTLTSLQMADPKPFIELCLEWMKNDQPGSNGPMALEPLEVPIFIGESTGLAPAAESEGPRPLKSMAGLIGLTADARR